MTNETNTAKCCKCNGRGTYRHFGICFMCQGVGRVAIAATATASASVALRVLRMVYAASKGGPDSDLNLDTPGAGAAHEAADAYADLIAHGETETAEKVLRAFEALSPAGHHCADLCRRTAARRIAA